MAAGGNTRLAILHELHAETGESRFLRVPCLCTPWSGEAGVLLAHLKENELRGNLSFIDRARAVRETQRLIEAETDESDMPLRRLTERLAERGYGVSAGLLSQMAYAVDSLLALIPQALEAGMGQPQVQRIRTLEKAVQRVWASFDLGDEDGFKTVFAALCRRLDGPVWDSARLRRALELEIVERGEVSFGRVSLALDAVLKGEPPDPPPAPDTDERFEPEIRAVARGQGAPPAEARAAPDGASPHPAPSGAEPTASSAPGLDTAEPSGGSDPAEEAEETAETLEPTGADLVTTGRPGPVDLKSLRSRAWTLAARLAQRNGFGERIQPLAGTGLGYILTDVPDQTLAERLDEADLAYISMLWWQLAACAEVTVAPVERLVGHLAAGGLLRRALEAQDAELLFESVWTLDPGHTGYRLWRRLDDRDWQDLLNLMDTYRAIHRQAVDADLWEEQP